MKKPYHLTCLLRNLYVSQEATVRTRHGTMNCFKIGKGVHQGCKFSHCLFKLYTVHQAKYQTGWITVWNQDCKEKYQHFRMSRWYHSNGRKWRGVKSLLRVKEGCEKISLNIQNTKVMGSSPITSWQIEGENLEAVTDFLFFVSKITADNDCSHEIKRWLLLERKAMTNLDSILKSRDINFEKVCIVKAIFFPSNHVWMWELNHKEGWGLKNWCLRIMVMEKTLDSSLDCKIKPVNLKRNQPWILIGKTDTEAEAPIHWPPDWKSQLIGKDPDAGKDWR